MSKNLIGQTLLGQYRVDAFLAAGGMGAVYQVWDQKRSVPLAMKVLRSDLAEDPSIIKRFKREANALKKLTHPNIVPFYGLYQTELVNFLLEAYIDGPTLKEIIKNKTGQPFSVDDILIYLKALSAALGYAHAHGVVHCDVKPGNVMVDKGGNIYLTDFGIARHAESTTTSLPTVGTAAYMAPEQIRGDAVTPATDVYALGIIIYEMIAGRRPFQGDGNDTGGGSTGATAAERIRYGHLNLPPPDPRSYNPVISESLARIMLRALAKNSKDRFQNVREFYEAILAISGQTHTSIPDRATLVSARGRSVGVSESYPPIPPSSGALTDKFKRVPIWIWGVGGIIIIILLIFAFRVGSSEAKPTTEIVYITATEIASETPVPTKTLEPSITPTITQTPLPKPTNTPTLSPTPTIEPLYDWLSEILQPSLAAGAFTSLAIDDQGYMHIAYFQDTGDIIWYAHNNNSKGEWLFENLHGEAGWGFHLSLALDNQGNPYIAFNNFPSKKRLPYLWYVFWTSKGWSQNFRNGNKTVTNTDVSLAMGLDNVPHFAYQWEEDNSLMYARFTSSQGFVDQKVDDSSGNCRSFPIALDKNGDPHVSYCGSQGGLKYAQLEGESWRRQVVDPSGSAGVYSAIALDANDQPHIAYYDQGLGALKYATLVGDDWEIQIIDDDGDVGQFPSIAVDLDGYVHISYYDASNTALKYAYGSVDGWYQEIVDNKGEVGEFSSIALMPSTGEPRISYYDDRNEDLKLAVATRK